MTVTLGVYGATNATGWTTVTPTEPSGEGSTFVGAGTRKIYVDSAAANDTGAGTQAAPKKTLLAGTALLRNGKPDHLYLKKGGVWTDEVFTNLLSRSGVSANEPLLISSYGTGARPLLKTNPKATGAPLILQGADTNGNYLCMIGIEFYGYKSDPDSPNYDAAVIPIEVIRGLNGNPFFLVEDCKATFLNTPFGWNAAGALNAGTVIYRRNVIAYNYDTDGSHAIGMYVENVDNLIIEENVFDHNGWNETVGTAPDIFKHDLYVGSLAGRSQPITVRGNILARASSHGFQQRPGGACFDNLCVNNAIAGVIGSDGTGEISDGNEVTWNVVLQGKDITPLLPRGSGLDINSQTTNTICKFNIIAHQESANPNANATALKTEPGASGAVITDNIIYDWASAGTPDVPISDAGTGSTISNNHIDQSGYLDPTRSCASYNSSLGGTASLDALLAECRLQSKDNWRTAYTANAVNNYIRAGFNMPAIIGTEPETAQTSSVGSRIVAHTSHSFSRKRFDELLAAIRSAEERAADLSVKAGKRQLRAAAAAAKQASRESITAREAHALAQSLKSAASAKALADRLDDAKKAVNQAYAILGQQDDDAMVAFLMMN